jgi:hypothetical protein
VCGAGLARSLSGKAGGGNAWNHAVDEIRRYQAAARVRIPVPADVYSRKLANLSGPGSCGARPSARDIFGAEELLGKLYGTCPGCQQ